MKKFKLLRMLIASGFLLSGSAGIVIAQAHGGSQAPGQTPTTPSTFPGQTNPNTNPGMNSPSDQNGPQPMQSKMDDKKFLKEAAEGGLTEVQLGQLAQQKASSDSVKQFAQKMIDDHTKANDKLKQVAEAENVQVPSTLDSKSQSRYDKLSKLSGDKFDKAYVKDQLKDHESDVKEFQAEAETGSDPKIKAFASETLPVLQQHLQLVKNLDKSEKETGKSTKGL